MVEEAVNGRLKMSARDAARLLGLSHRRTPAHATHEEGIDRACRRARNATGVLRRAGRTGHTTRTDLSGVLQQAVAFCQEAFRRLLEVLGHRLPLTFAKQVFDQSATQSRVRRVAPRVRDRGRCGGAHVFDGHLPVAILQRQDTQDGMRAIDDTVVICGLLMAVGERKRILRILAGAGEALGGVRPGFLGSASGFSRTM